MVYHPLRSHILTLCCWCIMLSGHAISYCHQFAYFIAHFYITLILVYMSLEKILRSTPFGHSVCQNRRLEPNFDRVIWKFITLCLKLCGALLRYAASSSCGVAREKGLLGSCFDNGIKDTVPFPRNLHQFWICFACAFVNFSNFINFDQGRLSCPGASCIPILQP